MLQRNQWLVSNRDQLDLRWVGHTGDITNWGWLVPTQYQVASNAMVPLENAGIPYSLAIGNHDTRAVGHNGIAGSRGYGGSAYVNNPECVERFSPAECKTWLLVRHTEEFNDVFNASRYTNVAGAYESGKVDNIFTTYDAGEKQWMMLTLELWPRQEVIDWANSVVAAHPNHNVIVQTHSYLDGNGAISTSNGGYGATSPMHLFNTFISQHPNIKMVFSGHTGMGASRVDTGVAGNKIVSFLQTFHSGNDNPVRIVKVNTERGTVESYMQSPKNNTEITGYRVNYSGMNFN